ncbi:unnamed protein product [Effrenium voratum]|nr:unnamed protein product [Effrenium voratum]
MRSHRQRAVLAIALLVGWRSLVFSLPGDHPTERRSALVGALGALALPSAAAHAKRGEQSTKEAMPAEIQTEESISEEWNPVDVGESTLVDPNDPKYKQMRIMADMEKQKARNEEYDSMSQEEKAQKMCELLGRGCQNIS